MEFKEFIEVVKDKVGSRLEEDFKVRLNPVVKNNGVELVGLVIYKKGIKIAPNIYLNELYDKYIETKDIEKVVSIVMNTYEEAMNSSFAKNFDFEYDFDLIKDKIYYKVVNYEKNKKLLESVPYKKFLDLAVVFYCLVNSEEEQIASIRITNDHLEMWEKDGQEILELASVNTPILFPGIIKSMKDVIKELIMKTSVSDIFGLDNDMCKDSNAYYFKGKKLDEDIIDEMLSMITHNKNCDMYVLTNTSEINGATSMLYNGLLEEFSKRVKANLYILPSSIHEVILIPYNEEFEIDSLKAMVREINNTKVPENEVLSDSVYIYQDKESAIFM